MSTTFKMKKNGTDVISFVLTPADFIDGVWETDEYAIQNFERVSLTASFLDFQVTDPNIVGSIDITPELVNVVAGEKEELGAPEQSQNGREGRATKVRFVYGPNVINFSGVDDIVPGPQGNEAVRVVKQNGDLGEALILRLLDNAVNPTNPWTQIIVSVTGLLK